MELNSGYFKLYDIRGIAFRSRFKFDQIKKNHVFIKKS